MLARATFLCVLVGSALLGCGRPGAPGPATGETAAPGAPSLSAAAGLLAALSDSSRAAASFPFDSPERTRWNYVPMARAGLPVKRMRPDQRAAAERLLRTGLSESGFERAMRVMEHEGILRTLEEARGVPGFERRDPGLYYVSLFGTPAADSAWGWRFEGHHLSVNVTELGDGGRVVAPLFIGANPARVPSGPHAGYRLLAQEEDLARELLHALSPRQRSRALISDTTWGEILTRNDPEARPLAFAGLPAAEMTAAQQAQLRRLLELYAGRMEPAAGRAQWERIERAGLGRLHFAWAGSTEPGEAHYYRIHGPTVLVEYDNSQNDANHVHTVWRDLENDFGGDLLRRHYERHPHR